MKNRLKFQCWNCEKVFSLMLETDEKPDLISECPYCSKGVLIELEPYRNKQTSIFRTDAPNISSPPTADAFPEIIATKKPDNNGSSKE